MIDLNLPAALDSETASRIRGFAHPNNRASEAGHPCVRFLVLSRLQQDKKVLPDLRLQRIFDEGNLHEDDIMAKLMRAGVRVVEQQRPFEWRKFQLAGHIDAKVAVNGVAYPLEIKSCSPNVFESVRPLLPHDLIHSKYSWVRKYPAQILLYMLMDNKDHGILLFKNKTTGEKQQKVFVLDDDALAYTEEILKKLERVNEFVAKGEAPPVELCDECRDCGFAKTLCFPDQDFGPGVEIISDAELEKKLLRWDELKAGADEFDALDKEIKDALKGKTTAIGAFMVESKEYERTTYDVPAEVKAQYATKTTGWRTNIVKIGA